MPATLTSLRIRNLALVEELEWPLDQGFIAITGETGSGKSIILGALKLLLGERADKSLIRTGAENCTVEAVFQMEKSTAPNVFKARNAWLEAQGLEPCDENLLIVKRAFTVSGTNRQFINGSPTTLAILKKLGDSLVDLHGPHDHQSLLATEKQLDLLDAFANSDPLREKFAEQFRALNRLSAERDALSTSEAEMEREMDLLRHQVREIESADLQPNEETAIMARYAVAGNSRRLAELSTQIVSHLADDEDSALARLAEIQRNFRELEKIDPAMRAAAETFTNALIELEETAREVRNYAEQLDMDEAQLAQLEERVTLFETLKRKYGPAFSDVIAFGEKSAARLQKIESRGEELEQLAKKIEAAKKTLAETGAALSKKRKTAAPKLAQEIAKQLRALGFKKSEFSISLTANEKPTSHGLEHTEFLFAPNPGEPPKPLRSIASSGEISRVMLAVKSALAEQDAIPLLVFDEIDANVGGEIAHAVGEKMRVLGERHQVLCITHLPQVAARANRHFVVTKEFQNKRTISDLREVRETARVEEIARMLGGKSDSANAHAKTLLSVVR